MKNIQKIYNAKEAQDKWYKHWEDKGYFYSTPDQRKPFTIVIPPPNVTGVLHMGHMLNNTIQDVLIRKARMMGYNACWVPGTDHASIATESKVVAKLAEKGIKKSDLSREEFLVHAFNWKDKHAGVIFDQLKKIGASCDWKRTKFTLDKNMSDSVVKVFVKLYNKGLIYRGIRMVNWDPSAQTAISDEEVIYKEIISKLYFISYNIENSNEKIIVATTRPETILGDSAICVNPNDNRYSHLKDKNAIIPIIGRKIPIIFDDYVDIEFGSGALKITPAHDINDYEIGQKHKLEIIDIINDDGTLNNNAGLYANMDRFLVREKIANDLEKNGFLNKIEKHNNKIGFSERTNTIIEPKISMQWFCKMDNMSTIALQNVMNDNINFYPKKYKNVYKYWIENIKDWCVSRQLWWGQQIPAYFYEGNKFVVAENKETALSLAKKENPNIKLEDLFQDEDVLDTWFSSWIWPISVFDGILKPNNKEIQYYYPTNDLVTGPDILFFWVARMIMSGYEFNNQMPFKNVYFTGIVRDKKGKKMSKSLGNSPDPINLIDKYGADGVRVGMLFCAPAGNDLPFDSGLCEQGRNFSNKIWNAFRLIKGWETSDIKQPESSRIAIIWFESIINSTVRKINLAFSKYRISEALMIIYKLIWEEFCSWFLEIVKPEYNMPIDNKTYESTIRNLEKILKLLHPFCPFLTEEIWHKIKVRNDDIIVAKWPEEGNINNTILEEFENTTKIIAEIRTIKKEQNIQNKNKLNLEVIKTKKQLKYQNSILKKLENLNKISIVSNKPKNAFSFMVKSNEYYIPFEDKINFKYEIEKIKKQIEYNEGFLQSIEKKLMNKKFIQNAPKNIVLNEKNKMNDVKSKIHKLNKKLALIQN